MGYLAEHIALPEQSALPLALLLHSSKGLPAVLRGKDGDATAHFHVVGAGEFVHRFSL